MSKLGMTNAETLLLNIIGRSEESGGRYHPRYHRSDIRVMTIYDALANVYAARASSLARSAMLAAGRSSPSHADICARRCGSSQCGQLNRVISRGKSAKLAGSRSNPVSTCCPVRGQTKFSAAIITYLNSPGREIPVWHRFMTGVSHHQRRIGARQADAYGAAQR